MDLREVAHLTGQGGVDGQGAAGNRRPNTRDNAAPKGKESQQIAQESGNRRVTRNEG
jgi:hypothetical protein